MAQIKFDPTINAGHILTMLAFAGTGFAAYYNLKGDLSVVDQRLKAVEVYMLKMTDMLVADARQDARIGVLEKRMDRVEATTPRFKVEAEARP